MFKLNLFGGSFGDKSRQNIYYLPPYRSYRHQGVKRGEESPINLTQCADVGSRFLCEEHKKRP